MEFLEVFLKPEVIWFLAGIVLLIMEFALPGVIILFFGIGAIVVGLLCLIFPLSLNLQLVIFILSSIILLVSLRKWLKKIFAGKADSAKEMDDFLDEFVGHQALVEEEIKAGKAGKVELKGTSWKAVADVDIAKGKTVEITNKDNLTLFVKPIQ